MKRRFKFKRKRRRLKKVVFFIIILLVIYCLYRFYNSLIYKNDYMVARMITSDNGYNKYNDPFYLLDNIIVKKKKENSITTNDYDVYIYSTHEKESYSDSYLNNYNIRPNVKMMSYILRDYLDDYGVNCYVEENSVTDILNSNNWAYKYSYEASRILIKDNILNNNYKLIIDLHRDSSSLEKTLLDINNTKYARILFVVGGEYDTYQDNYDLSIKLNNYLKDEVDGINRGVILKKGLGVNGVYNQDLSKNMVLIELGGQYNSIEELNNSLKILSKVISKYLEEV